MAQFVLHVPDIDEAGKQVRFAVPSAWLARTLEGSDLRADPSAEDGSLEIRADRSGADVVVTGTLEAHVVVDCVRCLEDAPVSVEVPVTWLFTARGDGRRPAPDEVELSPEELEREYYTGEDIELDEVVRDHIILEVPMQPLCAEDCAGIEIPAHVRPPADFGAEREDVDPRLLPLQKLAGKLNPNED